MTLEQFLTLVRSANPFDLAKESLHRDFVHAIPVEAEYKVFLDKVRADYLKWTPRSRQ